MSSIEGISTYGAYSALESSQNDLSTVMQEMSSGSSLTAESDPAGLSIDQMMNAQISGLQVASQNAQTGINVLQTAGGALGQTSDLLQQVRTLALQAANGTQDQSSLAALGDQATQDLDQIDQIASSTSFDGTNLLDGSQAGGLTFQTGASGTGADTTSISLPNVGTTALGLSGIDSAIANGGDMSSVLDAIDNASATVSATRSDIGATTDGLTDSINNISSSVTSLQQSDSTISGADMAQLSTQMASDNIKSQVSVALIAQANALNQQNALQLLSAL